MNAKNPVIDMPVVDPKQGSVTGAAAKREKWLDLLKQGYGKSDINRITGDALSTIDYHLKTKPEFAEAWAKVLHNRNRPAAPKKAGPKMSFEEFLVEYSDLIAFWHHQQMIDVSQGREPRDLDEKELYVPADLNMVCINMPPYAAKSTMMTVWGTVYDVCMDPTVRAAIICKTKVLATDFLLQIKDILTSEKYAKLQEDFAPAGGWNDGTQSWRSDRIWISNRDIDQKDPTVQALGIGGSPYGSRFDVVRIDDAIDGLNASQWPSQVVWLNTTILSRLAPITGRIMMVGTRMAAQDLYWAVMQPESYADGESPWTYFSCPAVLEYGEATDGSEDRTFWPRSNRPLSKRNTPPDEDGLYPAWGGPQLRKVRKQMPSIEAWERMYQQSQISTDQQFQMDDIQKCTQQRNVGPLPDHHIDGRAGGMAGLQIIGGVDPASHAGNAGVIVYGVDVHTGDRFLIDAKSIKKARTHLVRQAIRDLTVQYHGIWWQIEGNSNQTYLSEDPELNGFVASHGGRISSVYTGANKNDPDIGVLAMASLFSTHKIHLPRPNNEAIGTLVGELVAWEPHRSGHATKATDMVMALWFCERRALELVRAVTNDNFRLPANPWSSRGDVANMKTFNFQQIFENNGAVA